MIFAPFPPSSKVTLLSVSAAALDIAMQLNANGILDKYNVELIGANIEAIQKAENREKFKECMDAIKIPTAKGGFVNSYDDKTVDDYIGNEHDFADDYIDL